MPSKNRKTVKKQDLETLGLNMNMTEYLKIGSDEEVPELNKKHKNM